MAFYWRPKPFGGYDVCRFFDGKLGFRKDDTRGGCKHGNDCDFLHIESTSVLRGKHYRRCIYFNTDQGCPNYNDCTFAHVAEDNQQWLYLPMPAGPPPIPPFSPLMPPPYERFENDRQFQRYEADRRHYNNWYLNPSYPTYALRDEGKSNMRPLPPTPSHKTYNHAPHGEDKPAPANTRKKQILPTPKKLQKETAKETKKPAQLPPKATKARCSGNNPVDSKFNISTFQTSKADHKCQIVNNYNIIFKTPN